LNRRGSDPWEEDVTETGASTREIASADPPESDFSRHKILIATVCLLGVTFGTSLLLSGAQGYVLIPMTKAFGWTRTEFSFAGSCALWSGAALTPFVGRLTDQIGVRPLILGGTALLSLISFAMARQTSSLPMLYVLYALFGATGAMIIAYSKVIAGLFTVHRGKALAIFGVESTFASAAVPMIINALLSHYGWRGLYVAFGFIILAMLPLLYFFIPEPGMKGRPARSRGEDGTRSAPARPPVMEGATIGQALKSRPFLVMAAISFISSIPAAGLMVHLIPALEDKGFSQTIAAAYFSISLLIGVVGAAFAGYLMDKINSAWVAAPFWYLTGLGAVLLVLVTVSSGGLPLLYVTAGLCGFAQASTRPMNTYFHTRFFGLRAFTEIQGVERTLLAVVSGLSIPAVGYIFDKTHSYNSVFWVLVATSVICGSLYFFTGPYRYDANIGVAKSLAPEDEPVIASPRPAPAE
jgi:MFS family permease